MSGVVKSESNVIMIFFTIREESDEVEEVWAMSLNMKGFLWMASLTFPTSDI